MRPPASRPKIDEMMTIVPPLALHDTAAPRATRGWSETASDRTPPASARRSSPRSDAPLARPTLLTSDVDAAERADGGVDDVFTPLGGGRHRRPWSGLPRRPAHAARNSAGRLLETLGAARADRDVTAFGRPAPARWQSPSPRLPPVTIATLPASCRSIRLRRIARPLAWRRALRSLSASRTSETPS